MGLNSPWFRLAPVNVSVTFSVESKYYPRPWGVHKAWRKFPRGKRHKELHQNCPEIEIFDSNNHK